MASRIQEKLMGREERMRASSPQLSQTQTASRSRSADVNGLSEFTDWLRLSQKLSVSELVTLRLLTSWSTFLLLFTLCLLPSIH